MILVDWGLRQLCNNGLITPYDENLINPSSIDIRLGGVILVDSVGGYEEIDIIDTTEEDPFFIEPNGFLLACTYEKVNIPINYSAELKLKSSRARERLSHALAGHVDNGFQGSLTLELKNYSPYNPVPIHYMKKIGQIIIHQTRTPSEGYQNTEYSHADKPILSRYM
jgi:dCTP deaminase